MLVRTAWSPAPVIGAGLFPADWTSVLALPSGWCALDPPHAECDSNHGRLAQELMTELPPGHPLYRARVRIVAHDVNYDDVLVAHDDEPWRFTCVHLTWSGAREVPGCPTIACDGPWEAFLGLMDAVDDAQRQAAAAEAAGTRVPLGQTGTPTRPVVVDPPDPCRCRWCGGGATADRHRVQVR